MKLDNLDNLQHDTLTGHKYGPDKQLEVMGYRLNNGSQRKAYIVKCSICAARPSVYLEGVFSTVVANIQNGVLPCGCSKAPKFEEWQIHKLVDESARDREIQHLGPVSEYKSLRDYGKFLIKGKERTIRIQKFLNGAGGPFPPARRRKKLNRFSVDWNRFLYSDFYVEGTTFKKSEKQNKSKNYYWEVFCPDCGETNLATSSTLNKNKLPCSCANYKQRFAYINIVRDGEMPIAVKFGISNSLENRIDRQNSTNVLKMENYGVWEFKDKPSCMSAERQCKIELACRVLDRQLLKDGWTETTYSYNLEKIIEIYEQYGGIKIK